MKPTAHDLLPDDVADLLAFERAFPEPSELRQRRMFNRINNALAATAATGAAVSLSLVVAKAAAPQVAVSAAKSAGFVGAFLLKPALIVAVTAVAATSVVTLSRQDANTEAQSSTVQPRTTNAAIHRAKLSEAETPAFAPQIPPSQVAVAEIEQPQIAPRISPSARKSEAEALHAAERSLARGHAARVVIWAAAHARANPGSALAQERDALLIRALVMQRRTDRAQEQLAQFAQRYSQSIHLAALNAAVKQLE